MSLSTIATEGFLAGNKLGCVTTEGFLCGGAIVEAIKKTGSMLSSLLVRRRMHRGRR